MRFTLGPQAGYAPPGYPPQPGYDPAGYSQPATSDPTATYGSAPPTATQPIFDEPAASPASVDERPAARTRHDARKADPKRRGPGAAIATIGAAVLVLAIVVFGIVFAFILKRGMSQNDGVMNGDLAKPEWNFAYRMPGDPWSNDPDTKNDLNVNAFCIKREGPNAWAALSVSDFKDRSPLVHELREKMLDQLGRAFQNLPPDLTLEPIKWGGKDGYHCRFRGERRGTESTCLGDCYVLGYKGVGYWFYAWSAEADFDGVSTELHDLHDRFRTLNERDKWAEKVGNKLTFPRKGKHTVKYQVATYEKFWKEFDAEPTDVRAKADLALKGELVGRNRQDRPPYAELVVLVVESNGEPMEVAAKEIRAFYNRDPEVFGKFSLTELTAEPSGDPPIGEDEPNVAPLRFKVSPVDPNASKSVEKLVVYSAIRVDDKIAIVEASCPWSQREIWERRLIQFAGSLKAK